jgi:hypothetical protein
VRRGSIEVDRCSQSLFVLNDAIVEERIIKPNPT